MLNLPRHTVTRIKNGITVCRNETKIENVTALISGHDNNSTLLSPNLTIERMDSYLHLVPQMFYFSLTIQ